MKKGNLRIITLMVAIMLIFTFAFYGCSDDDGDDTTTTASTTKAGKIVTVKIFNSIGAYKALFEESLVEFNDTIGKEKGVVVEIETNIDRYREVLDIALKAGNHPDIFNINTVVPAYVQNGWAYAIDDIEGGPELLAKYEGLLKPIVHQVDGKTYTLPYEFLPIKLAYNKDLFKKAGIVDANGEAMPPKTWAEVVDYAKRITAVGEGKQFGYGFTYAWGGGFQRLLCKAYIPSVGHFWFNHQTGKYDFSAFAPAFEYLLQMKEDGSLFPGPESIQIDPIRAQFSEGNVGMITAPAYDVGVYNDQFPAKIDWSVCDLPVDDLNATRYKEPALERAHFGMSSTITDDRIQGVFEVFKFINDDDQLAKLYSENAFIPYKAEIIQIAERDYTIKNKVGWAEFSGNLEISYGVFPRPDSLLSIEGMNEKEVFEQIFIGKVSIEEGLADLDKRYNAALEQAIADGKLKLEDYKFDIDLTLE